MIIGLSIGCAYKFINSRNKDNVITLYRENFPDMNAIEIIIPKKDLNHFKLSRINFEWLSSLEYISYHLLSQNCYSQEMNIFYKLPSLNAMICHADKKTELEQTPYFFNSFKNRIIYENTESNNDYYFEDIFDICFDTSHALKSGYCSFKKFCEENKSHFREIHLSNFSLEECHTTFYPGHRHFNFIKKHINLKEYPIIIENACDDFEELKREYNFIKENM